MVPSDVPHSAIARALATLGERAGRVEVAASLLHEWEPFETQMRRRRKTRARCHSEAYEVLGRAGAEKVRRHLEVTGALPRRARPRSREIGVVVRVRGPRRRALARSGHRGGGR